MQQYFSVISQDADKLTNLVTNILDFSKIEEGKKEYNFVETDVSQWMIQFVENLKKNDVQKDLSIQSDIAPDLPAIVLDRNALSQALNNLVDNAEKFSQHKKEIEMSAKRENESIVISVTDYGIGIPQSEIDKIFDKFYQGKSALSQSVRGTGLGLTLVKHIVEAHRGSVSVKSEKGKGSTFSLILPVEKKEG
jgi:signal transduction histidine kinase